MEEPALIHWPDGTEDVIKVHPEELSRPFVFAEHVYAALTDTNPRTKPLTEKVNNVLDGKWRFARQEPVAGTLEGGRAYSLKVWIEPAPED